MGFNFHENLLLNEFRNFEPINMIQQRENFDEDSNSEFEDEDVFDQINPDIFDQLIRGINEDFDDSNSEFEDENVFDQFEGENVFDQFFQGIYEDSDEFFDEEFFSIYSMLIKFVYVMLVLYIFYWNFS